MNEQHNILSKLIEALRLVNEAQDHYFKALKEGDIHTTTPLPKPDNEDCPVIGVGDLISIAKSALAEAKGFCKDMEWPDEEDETGVQQTRLQDLIEKTATDLNKVVKLGVN